MPKLSWPQNAVSVGEVKQFRFRFVNSDGTPFDLTVSPGWTVELVITNEEANKYWEVSHSVIRRYGCTVGSDISLATLNFTVDLDAGRYRCYVWLKKTPNKYLAHKFYLTVEGAYGGD